MADDDYAKKRDAETSLAEAFSQSVFDTSGRKALTLLHKPLGLRRGHIQRLRRKIADRIILHLPAGQLL